MNDGCCDDFRGGRYHDDFRDDRYRDDCLRDDLSDDCFLCHGLDRQPQIGMC